MDKRFDDFLSPLLATRRRLRVLLVVEAMATLLAVAVGLFALMATLDWWVHFPMLIRLAACLAGAASATIWFCRRIWRPAVAPINLEHLALRMGRLDPSARDRLASAVAYLGTGGEGSNELWERLLAETARSTSKLSLLESVLPTQAIRATLWAAAAVMPIVLAAMLVPKLLGVGWHRLATPMADVQWPRSVEVEPLTSDAVVPFGEAFSAEMRLARGDDPDLRSFIIWKPINAPLQRDLMRRDADGIYRLTLENVRTPISYYFAAGDDDTSPRPFHLSIAHRPAVQAAQCIIEPPPYLGSQPPTIQPLDEGSASALQGSRVRLEITPDRPLKVDGSDQSSARAAFEGGRTITLHRGVGSAGTLTAEFEADRTVAFEIVLTDGDGLESRGGPRLRLEVRTDEPPTVSILEPAGIIEVTPIATVSLKIAASDDHGLSTLTLLSSRGDLPLAATADLLESKADSSGTLLHVDVLHHWSLVALHAAEGDVIRYAVEARDNFQLNGKTHSAVRSGVQTLRIVSQAQFAERLRIELFSLSGQLRGLLSDLQSSRDQARALAASTPSAAADERTRAAISRVAAQLESLIAVARRNAARLGNMAGQARMNQAAEMEAARQAESLARTLTRAAEGSLREAHDLIARAADATDPAARREDLATASKLQDQAAEALQSLLADMQRGSDFAEIVRRLHEVLDRQESLQRDVAALAKATSGRASDQLSATDRLDLIKAASRQSQLRADLAQLLTAISRLASDLHTADTVAADALLRATQLAEARTVLHEMDEAAQAIGLNQLNNAASAQRGAADGLRAMLSALDEKPTRELAELSKNLQDVVERLRRVIAAQDSLLTRCREARSGERAAEETESLADRQTSLAETTRQLAARIKKTNEESEKARKELSSAATRMDGAADRLSQSQLDEVEAEQGAALASLHEALALLQQLDDKTQQALAERSLMLIAEALSDIRHKQAALRADTGDIEARRARKSVLSRTDGLKLNRLAKDQNGLIGSLRELRKKLESSAVYDYVGSQIVAAMEAASIALTGHECPTAMTEQDRALRDLDRLINSIAETRPGNEKQFVESSGGGDAAAPTAGKPVPTLAELKVLRLMQADVNDRTAAVAKAQPEPLRRTEAQLKEVETLGKKQRDLHSLAVKMIKKAAEMENPK